MSLVYREKTPITTPRGGNFVSAGEKRQNQAGQKLLPGLIASCVAGKRGTYRSVAPQSFSRASRMLFISTSAHPAGCGIRREPKSKEGAAGMNPAAPKVSAAPKRLDALCAPRTAGSRRRREHQRSVAAQSFSRVSRMLFTSASAHPAGCGIRREPKSKEGAAGMNPAAPKVSAAPKRLDALCAPRTAGSRRRREHQRSVAAQSFSRVSRMLFTSASASSAVRERSSERRTRLKATDFFPSATPLPR